MPSEAAGSAAASRRAEGIPRPVLGISRASLGRRRSGAVLRSSPAIAARRLHGLLGEP